MFANLGIQNTDIQGSFVIPIFLYYKWKEMQLLQRAINFLSRQVTRSTLSKLLGSFSKL